MKYLSVSVARFLVLASLLSRGELWYANIGRIKFRWVERIVGEGVAILFNIVIEWINGVTFFSFLFPFYHTQVKARSSDTENNHNPTHKSWLSSQQLSYGMVKEGRCLKILSRSVSRFVCIWLGIRFSPGYLYACLHDRYLSAPSASPILLVSLSINSCRGAVRKCHRCHRSSQCQSNIIMYGKTKLYVAPASQHLRSNRKNSFHHRSDLRNSCDMAILVSEPFLTWSSH